MAVWLDRMLAGAIRRYVMPERITRAKRPLGRVNLGWSRYMAMLDAATNIRERAYLLGHSPGMAASLAGVSRQAIHEAISANRITALYIHDDDSGELRAILIPHESLAAYIAAPTYQRRRSA